MDVGAAALVGVIGSGLAEAFKFLLPIQLLPEWYRDRAKLLISAVAIFIVMLISRSDFENFGLFFLTSWLAAGGFYTAARTVTGMRNKINANGLDLVKKILR